MGDGGGGEEWRLDGVGVGLGGRERGGVLVFKKSRHEAVPDMRQPRVADTTSS